MLTDSERSRLGELKSRVDLSSEEQKEADHLTKRFREQAVGKIDADFLAIKDANGGSVIPYSDAAKEAMPNTMVPRDRQSFDATLEDLERRGYTIERKKAAYPS
jgi:C4-type Zn-finger protein